MHESVCLIGLYSSHANAVSAAFKSSTKPGFRSFLQGFSTHGVALEVVHWSDGFDVREAPLRRLLSFTLSSLPSGAAA